MVLVRQRHVPALRAAKHGWTNGAGSKSASWVHRRVPEGCFRSGATLAPMSLGMQKAEGMPVTMSQPPLPASSLSLKPLFFTSSFHIMIHLFCFSMLLCISDLLPLTCCPTNEHIIISFPSLLSRLNADQGGFL